MLNVSPSGYYAWLKRPISKRAQEEARLEVEIKAAHKRNRETAGPETLQHEIYLVSTIDIRGQYWD
jgi:hypothetical protein